MRRFFRGFSKAARNSERAAMKALRGTTGARKIAAQESLDAVRVGAEAAEVEPVAGRLPRNHEYAGKEFPREFLPPKYREKGLRFKSTGYPDFEPYAMTLTNGKKTVRIELTGSREADWLAANRAAGFQRTPEGYAWHHLEDEGVAGAERRWSSARRSRLVEALGDRGGDAVGGRGRGHRARRSPTPARTACVLPRTGTQGHAT